MNSCEFCSVYGCVVLKSGFESYLRWCVVCIVYGSRCCGVIVF